MAKNGKPAIPALGAAPIYTPVETGHAFPRPVQLYARFRQTLTDQDRAALFAAAFQAYSAAPDTTRHWLYLHLPDQPREQRFVVAVQERAVYIL